MIRKFGCALIIIGLLIGCSAQENVVPLNLASADSVKNSIRTLEGADPAQDIERAIKKGDLRFIGVMGYSLIVPGVEDYHERYEKNNGVRIIEGASDFILSDDVQRLNELATDYAERYNKLLLEYLSHK